MHQNPSITVGEFAKFLRDKGQERLAFLTEKHPDVVEIMLPKITEKMLQKGLIGADGRMRGRAMAKRHGEVLAGARELGRMAARRDTAASSRGLTDAEAWAELAELVPKALGDQPAALQEALIRAFRNEAAKAA